MTNKNIIITGGAGYVGSHICKKLKNNGFNIYCLDNLSRGNKWAVKWGELLIGDLHDITFLEKSLKKIEPISIIHLAAFADIGESNLKPFMYYENNIKTTINLLKALKNNNLNNIIFSSSCSTFGNISKSNIYENDLMNPLSPYAFSKMVCENIIKSAQQENNIEYVILRYFNAAGADLNNEIGESNENHKRIIPQIIKSVINNKNLQIYGNDYKTHDGTCVRDFVHVNDIADAHFLAVQHLLNKKKSDDFNIGSGTGYSILEIVNKIESFLSKKVKFSFLPRRRGDADCLVASIKKAKETLGWRPICSDLNTILNTAINWEKKK